MGQSILTKVGREAVAGFLIGLLVHFTPADVGVSVAAVNGHTTLVVHAGQNYLAFIVTIETSCDKIQKI